MSGSAWSDVDHSEQPGRFVAGLDRLRVEPFFVEQKARLLAALELRGDERVADVGCGTGEDTAELDQAGCAAIGVERAFTMLAEARRRHPGLCFVAADAGRLPFPDTSLDRVRVDRVLQHLARGADAVREWKRVLRPGGRVAVFEPDLTTARIYGTDQRSADAVVGWRASTRPGADAVRSLPGLLGSAGFVDVEVEAVLLDLDDLGRADGIMGLAGWGEAARHAGRLPADAAARWREEISTAWRRGLLRYTCSYVLGSARVG